MSRAEDIADLGLLVRAILVVWDARRPCGLLPSRESLVVMLLVVLPYDRQRLEHLLACYGRDLFVVFDMARRELVTSETVAVRS